MKKFIIIALILFVLFIVAITGLYFFSMKEVEKLSRQVLRGNPVVEEHIGELQEIDWNVIATGEVGQEDTLVFDVVGSKGSGRITIQIASQDDQAVITDGEVELTDGTTHPLIPPETETSE